MSACTFHSTLKLRRLAFTGKSARNELSTAKEAFGAWIKQEQSKQQEEALEHHEEATDAGIFCEDLDRVDSSFAF